jgi:hypothetical protein
MTLLDELFPRWVETIELAPTSSRRFEALRSAVDAVAARVQPHRAFVLTEYAVGVFSREAFDVVMAAVAARDPSFAPAPADLEPRLVAAAILARTMERHDDSTAVAAGAVLSAEFAGLEFAVAELPDLARAAVSERFRKLRGRLPPVPMRAEADDTSGADALARWLVTLEDNFDTRLDAVNEELDILWWAFAAQDSGDRLGWNEARSAEKLLSAGRQMADLHRFNGEIPSAREIAKRVIGAVGSEEYALADVVPPGAMEVQIPGLIGEPLLPILTCAAAYGSGADEHSDFALEPWRDWAGTAREQGVDPSMRRRGDEIVAQTVRELLLARALADV